MLLDRVPACVDQVNGILDTVHHQFGRGGFMLKALWVPQPALTGRCARNDSGCNTPPGGVTSRWRAREPGKRAIEPTPVLQRMLTVAAGGRIHADHHQAVVELGDWRCLDGRLDEVQQS